MKCPFCRGPDTSVVDSRLTKLGEAIRRRRECNECHRRFTTFERVEEYETLVVKKDGSRESFKRQKLIDGLRAACQKRQVSADDIEAFVVGVEQRLQESQEREVPSARLGAEAMAFLKSVDPVAYIRFASVYRSFEDIQEFMAELSELLAERAGGRSS